MTLNSCKTFLALLATCIGGGVCAEWCRESSAAPYTVTNDCWRITLNKIDSNYVNITDLESLDGNPDETTLDASGLLGLALRTNNRMVGFTFTASSSTNDALKVRTLILSTNTYETIRVSALKSLTEIRTGRGKDLHTISVRSLPEYAFNGTRLAGSYVIRDCASIGKGAFRDTGVEDVRFVDASCAGFASAFVFYGCTNLTYFSFGSSQPFTSFGGTDAMVRTALPAVYFPDVTYLPDRVINACPQLEEAVFPSVESFGAETALGSCPKLRNVVFGTTGLFRPGNKNFRFSFTQAQAPQVIINTKQPPAFEGSVFFFVDVPANTLTCNVRKEARWTEVDFPTNSTTVVQVDGTYYLRYDAAKREYQQPLRFMDTAIALNVRCGGKELFRTILPGMAGTNAEYRVRKDMLLPPENRFYSVKSVTEGVDAVVEAQGAFVRVTVPESLFPEPSDDETKDLAVDLEVEVGPVRRPGMSLFIR